MKSFVSLLTVALLGISLTGTLPANAMTSTGDQNYWHDQAHGLDKEVALIKTILRRGINESSIQQCHHLDRAIIQALHVKHIADLGLDPGLAVGQPVSVRRHFKSVRDYSNEMHHDLKKLLFETC